MDNMLSIKIQTPSETARELAARFKARRLTMDLSQEGLARRSGVSWSSLKRFERTGLIALDSLLRLAVVLDCLQDFERICAEPAGELASKTLDQILATPKIRRKGRRK